MLAAIGVPSIDALFDEIPAALRDVSLNGVPKGLNEDIIAVISAKKNEPPFMLDWRLKAFRHWQTMEEPRWWPNIAFAPIDYQNIVYYSAPKQMKKLNSLDEVRYVRADLLDLAQQRLAGVDGGLNQVRSTSASSPPRSAPPAAADDGEDDEAAPTTTDSGSQPATQDRN